MKKMLTVIKYEYLRRVKTVGFIIGTILTPLIFAALMVVPGLMANMNIGGATRLAIVDESGKMYGRARVQQSVHKRRESQNIESGC